MREMKKGALEIARSYTSVLAQHAVIYLISLATFGIIARILNTYDIGVYGLTVSIVYLIGLSANFGLKKSTIKIISQVYEKDRLESRKIFWTSLFLSLFFILIFSSGTVFLFKYLRIFSIYKDEELYYLLLFLLIFLFSIRNHVAMGLEALKEFHIETVYVSMGFLIYRLLMVTLVILQLRILGILISWVIGEAVSLLLILYRTGRYYYPVSIGKVNIDNLLRESSPIFISDMILSLVDYGDRVLTTIFGFSAVAFFYIASTGAMAIGAFGQALYSGMLPHLSEEYIIGEERLITRIQDLNRYVYIFISPIYLMGIALSYPVILILVGPGYSQAAAIFQVLALGLWISSIAPINQTALIASGKARYLMYIMVIGLVCEFLSIILLYPFLGIIATGFGKALLLTIGFVLSTFIIIKEWGMPPLRLSDYIKPTIAGILSAFVTWLSWIVIIRIDLILLNIIIGGLAYLILLRLFRVIRVEELAELYKEIPFRKGIKIVMKVICIIVGIDYQDLENYLNNGYK